MQKKQFMYECKIIFIYQIGTYLKNVLKVILKYYYISVFIQIRQITNFQYR
jgi:hypothetical protein